MASGKPMKKHISPQYDPHPKGRLEAGCKGTQTQGRKKPAGSPSWVVHDPETELVLRHACFHAPSHCGQAMTWFVTVGTRL